MKEGRRVGEDCDAEEDRKSGVEVCVYGRRGKEGGGGCGGKGGVVMER